MRDAWEEVAAFVCALWSLCAVPVVIVDTVAMPWPGDWFDWGIEGSTAYVPVKDVEAVDRHRRVVSGEPLAFRPERTTQTWPDQWKRPNANAISGRGLFCPSLRSKTVAPFSDVVLSTIHLGITIQDDVHYEPFTRE